MYPRIQNTSLMRPLFIATAARVDTPAEIKSYQRIFDTNISRPSLQACAAHQWRTCTVALRLRSTGDVSEGLCQVAIVWAVQVTARAY